MSPESERAAEAREWLVKAALDFRGVQIDLAATPPLLEDALFHCQQAVGKWAFRYPGAAPAPDEAEAHDAMRLAFEVAAAIVGRLPSDAAPPGLLPGAK